MRSLNDEIFEQMRQDMQRIRAEDKELFRILDEITLSDRPSKYHVRLKGAWVDVYDVLHAFSVTNPGDQHAIKKMLMPGNRGHKNAKQDRREAIKSLERAIDLEGDNV